MGTHHVKPLYPRTSATLRGGDKQSYVPVPQPVWRQTGAWTTRSSCFANPDSLGVMVRSSSARRSSE